MVSAGGPVSTGEFASRLDPLGPFEPHPHLAVAVSGGADSMALALMTHRWASARGGRVTALAVDHGLRPEAADEARTALARLASHGIAGRLLTLDGLRRGAGLAARGRDARYGALARACAEAGILHLLLGHHAADQAETVILRLHARSDEAGLAAMAAVSETADVRLLRPLLDIAPVRLRDTLRAAGVAWAEDPSNADPASTRARLRALRRDADGSGPATTALVAAARARGAARAAADREVADVLAQYVRFDPAGFAVVASAALPPAALGAVIAAVAGSGRALSRRRLGPLAAALGPATIGGVRLLAAGRLAPGAWLVVREAAAMAPAVAARQGAVWDRRFRCSADVEGATLGSLGADAARYAGDRVLDRLLPAAVLRTLPAVRRGGALVAVPHLRTGGNDAMDVLWCPPLPAACAPFARH